MMNQTYPSSVVHKTQTIGHIDQHTVVDHDDILDAKGLFYKRGLKVIFLIQNLIAHTVDQLLCPLSLSMSLSHWQLISLLKVFSPIVAALFYGYSD